MEMVAKSPDFVMSGLKCRTVQYTLYKRFLAKNSSKGNPLKIHPIV